MKKTAKTQAKPTLPQLQTLVSSMVRWRILEALLKEGNLPCNIIAQRVGEATPNVFRHLDLLWKWGVLEKGYGSLYRIPEQYRVPGEMSLDLKMMVLRFDVVDNG